MEQGQQTPKEKANAFARRFKGNCDYVYRWERDETARLLKLFGHTLNELDNRSRRAGRQD